MDTNSITSAQNPDAAMPPSGPPERSDEEHSYIALIVILSIIVPVGAFLVYLHFENNSSKKPKVARKPYTPVNMAEGLPKRKSGDISFKFEM